MGAFAAKAYSRKGAIQVFLKEYHKVLHAPIRARESESEGLRGQRGCACAYGWLRVWMGLAATCCGHGCRGGQFNEEPTALRQCLCLHASKPVG
jgi:hypothetical protein